MWSCLQVVDLKYRINQLTENNIDNTDITYLYGINQVIYQSKHSKDLLGAASQMGVLTVTLLYTGNLEISPLPLTPCDAHFAV